MPQDPNPPASPELLSMGDKSSGGRIMPFPGAGRAPRTGVTALAVAIVLGRAIVAAARIVVPIALLLLAAVGLLRLLGQ